MRIALLSALAEAPDRPGERLAYRRFAGRSVLAHQIDCCASLDCESVIVLARGLGQDLLAAQTHCERADMRFQQIDSIARLANLVTAADEIVLIVDGLFPDLGAMTRALSARSSVLAFPDKFAISLGFERIDPTRAWAGVLRTGGECVARLLDMPADIDMTSALLRIVLQAGTRIDELDDVLLRENRWQKLVDEDGKGVLETRWLRQHLAPAPYTAPGLAIAERAGMRLSRDISGSRRDNVPLMVAVVGGIVAAGVGLLGHPAIGLAIALTGEVAWAVAAVIERVARVGRNPVRSLRLTEVIGLGYDLLIVSLLALSIPDDLAWIRLFIPAILVGLLRLGQRSGHVTWRPTYADRITLLAILLPFAFLGYVASSCAILALLILLSLFRADGSGELTGA